MALLWLCYGVAMEVVFWTGKNVDNCKSQIPNSKFQIPNSKFQIPNSKSQITNHKSQIQIVAKAILRDNLHIYCNCSQNTKY